MTVSCSSFNFFLLVKIRSEILFCALHLLGNLILLFSLNFICSAVDPKKHFFCFFIFFYFLFFIIILLFYYIILLLFFFILREQNVKNKKI